MNSIPIQAPPWTLRQARPDDAPALEDCIDAAYERYAGRIPDLPAVSEGCAQEIAAQRCWVAVSGNAVIGGLFLRAQHDSMKLVNVAVHPDHAGKGLGHALIAHAEDQAVRQGFAVLTLNTHAAMHENIAHYTRLGWIETKRDGNTVSMRKLLRAGIIRKP